jgi:molecular chaperone DnaK (HSP70)
VKPELHPDGGEPARYLVGIDLGTTNSAVAYIDAGRASDKVTPPRVIAFDVPQLVAEGDTQPRPTLPSFLYLPGPHELPAGATRLPWDAERPIAVGEFARRQGARVPARLVASAKSWLCHGGVDRVASICPGRASDDAAGLTGRASARYLTHMREAWNYTIARGEEASLLERQEVALTVPASFDEVARELTLEAARVAGLPRVTMIEEPQAAFYAWIVAHEATWSEFLAAGQVILVCDVGGGTTDFTLIVVEEGRAGLRFERVAVGYHLLLGGDNMDLALARRVEERLTGKIGASETGARRGSRASRLPGGPCSTMTPRTASGSVPTTPWAILERDRRHAERRAARAEVEETLLAGFSRSCRPMRSPSGGEAGSPS